MGSDTLNKKEMVTDFSKQQLCFEHQYKWMVVPLRERIKTSQGVIKLICNENVSNKIWDGKKGVIGYLLSGSEDLLR